MKVGETEKTETGRCDGSLIGSVPCVRKFAGSNPTLAITLEPWACPSLTVACGASAC